MSKSSKLLMIDSITDCGFCGTNKVQHTIVKGRITYRSYVDFYSRNNEEDSPMLIDDNEISTFTCQNCQKMSIRIKIEDNEKPDGYKYIQVYPIHPDGKPLDDVIPDDIKKDFDEARLIVNYSVRCANVLLRICIEKICNFIGDQFQITFTEKDKLGHKIEKIKNNNSNIGLNSKIFDLLFIIKEYGNDNAHSMREISDSDSKESFDILSNFLHQISANIATILKTNEIVNNFNSKGNISNKV